MVALVAGVSAVGATSPTSAQEPGGPSLGGALVEVCVDSPVAELPEIGPRACKTLDAGAVLAGLVCGKLPVPPAACADLTDGRVVDPAAVDAYVDSWVPRALRLQADLDAPFPLRDALIPHTHNSFNARTYDINLSSADPNHLYSLTDQLRMGIRAIELDLHWFPHASELGGNAVVLCHGQVEEIAGLTIHLGCSVDRLVDEGLAEIAAFLAALGNEDELVLLYLQNQLDGDPTAHASAIASIEEHLGHLVARPTGASEGSCADLPVERSRQSFLDAGHRVILVGNCGPGPWASWVFERGDGWNERGNSAGYPAFPDCVADRAARGYDERLIRVTEDLTWLSAMVGSPAPISEAEVRSMVRCGVELIGLDRIGPADPRLAALVWSWAPDEPAADRGSCAAWGDDARFRAADCDQPLRVACRDAESAWVVPEAAVAWTDAFALCDSLDATFAVPPSAWQNEQLRAAALGEAAGTRAADAPTDVLWLALARTESGWQPHLESPDQLVAAGAAAAPPVVPDRPGRTSEPPATPAVPTDPPPPGSLPTTGGPVAPVVAALAVLGAALCLRRAVSG